MTGQPPRVSVDLALDVQRAVAALQILGDLATKVGDALYEAANSLENLGEDQ
mgnify:CR=1 FL=1|jgi:hypothetical protein